MDASPSRMLLLPAWFAPTRAVISEMLMVSESIKEWKFLTRNERSFNPKTPYRCPSLTLLADLHWRKMTSCSSCYEKHFWILWIRRLNPKFTFAEGFSRYFFLKPTSSRLTLRPYYELWLIWGDGLLWGDNQRRHRSFGNSNSLCNGECAFELEVNKRGGICKYALKINWTADSKQGKVGAIKTLEFFWLAWCRQGKRKIRWELEYNSKETEMR